MAACSAETKRGSDFVRDQLADCIERGFGQEYCQRWEACVSADQKMVTANCRGNCSAAQAAACYQEYEKLLAQGQANAAESTLRSCAIFDSYAEKFFEIAQALFIGFSASCSGVPLSPLLWGSDL